MYLSRTTLLKSLSLLSLGSILLMQQGCIAAAAGGAATGAVMAGDRRTTGTMLDDKTLELKAIHEIGLNKTLWTNSHITVISYNNILLLVGQTSTEALKQQAFDAVSALSKVRRVHNEISVGPMASLATRSHDSWITAQIKSRLLGTKNISANRIKVVTEEGVVYLMGLVTPEEENTATEIARAISGVDKVVQIFERSE